MTDVLERSPVKRAVIRPLRWRNLYFNSNATVHWGDYVWKSRREASRAAADWFEWYRDWDESPYAVKTLWSVALPWKR